MSSHVAFFNFPALGHLTPSLGVVEELVRRGHRVTSTATDYFVPVVEAAGAEAVRYRSEFGEYYTSPFTQEAIAGEGLRTLNEATSELEQVEDFYRQNRPDVLVYDFMVWGARFWRPNWKSLRSGSTRRTRRTSTSPSRRSSRWPSSPTPRSLS